MNRPAAPDPDAYQRRGDAVFRQLNTATTSTARRKEPSFFRDGTYVKARADNSRKPLLFTELPEEYTQLPVRQLARFPHGQTEDYDTQDCNTSSRPCAVPTLRQFSLHSLARNLHRFEQLSSVEHLPFQVFGTALVEMLWWLVNRAYLCCAGDAKMSPETFVALPLETIHLLQLYLLTSLAECQDTDDRHAWNLMDLWAERFMDRSKCILHQKRGTHLKPNLLGPKDNRYSLLRYVSTLWITDACPQGCLLKLAQDHKQVLGMVRELCLAGSGNMNDCLTNIGFLRNLEYLDIRDPKGMDAQALGKLVQPLRYHTGDGLVNLTGLAFSLRNGKDPACWQRVFSYLHQFPKLKRVYVVALGGKASASSKDLEKESGADTEQEDKQQRTKECRIPWQDLIRVQPTEKTGFMYALHYAAQGLPRHAEMEWITDDRRQYFLHAYLDMDSDTCMPKPAYSENVWNLIFHRHKCRLPGDVGNNANMEPKEPQRPAITVKKQRLAGGDAKSAIAFQWKV